MDTKALKYANKKVSNMNIVAVIFILLGIAYTLILIKYTNIYFSDCMEPNFRSYNRISIEGLIFLTICALSIYIIGIILSTVAIFNKKGLMIKLAIVLNTLFLILGLIFLLLDKKILYHLIYWV